MLDLQSGDERGLLLPQVTLISLSTWAPLTGSEVEGMMVFNKTNNITNGLSKGIYVWTEGNWSKGDTFSLNPNDYNQEGDATDAGITWFLSGIICFDVRNSLVPSAQYNLVVGNATVTNVIWDFADAQSVLTGSMENVSGVTLTFKDQTTVSAIAPATVVVTAYITMDKDGTTYKVAATKTIKFLNTLCCDGAVIINGAYDYSDGSPGDGAKAGDAVNDIDAPWSPNATIPAKTYYNADVINSFFTTTNLNLCVYKTNGNSGNATDWADAVNNCANGYYADGDASAGWYLPNTGELQAIYEALGGNGSGVYDFANIQAPSYVATNAGNMHTRDHWSSTERHVSPWAGAKHAYCFLFNQGAQLSGVKGTTYSVRCVRRM